MGGGVIVMVVHADAACDSASCHKFLRGVNRASSCETTRHCSALAPFWVNPPAFGSLRSWVEGL